MFKSAATSITAKSITAVTAAVIVAGLAAFCMSAVPEAKAESQIERSVPQQSHAKSDRLPLLATGAACSSQSWPNYDRNCQFDLRRPANDAPAARRIIALR